MRRVLTSLALLVLVTTPALPAMAAELQPLMAGWEHYFTVSWQPSQYRGQPAVEGYVTNTSPYSTRAIRVLIESLDTAGQVTTQQIAFVPGDLLGGGRLFFQVPAASAPGYRVRVFSYDRIELDGPLR